MTTTHLTRASLSIEFEKGVDENSLNVRLFDAFPSLAASLRRVMMQDIFTWAVSKSSIGTYTGDEPWEHVVSKLDELVFSARSTTYAPSEFHQVDAIVIPISFFAPFTTQLFPITADQIVHPALNAADPAMVIATLRRGQILEAELTVTRQSGAFHDKWSPAVAVGTFLQHGIKLNKSLLTTHDDSKGTKQKRKPSLLAKSLVSSCPTGVFVWNNDIEDLAIDMEKCIGCRQCENDFGNSLNLTIEPNPNACCLHIETNNTMTAMVLFKESLRALITICESL